MLKGIVNVRGEIKLVVDLKNLFKIEISRTQSANDKVKIFKRHIVVKKGKDSWVFQVDEVMGIWKFNERKVTPLPSTAKEDSSNYLRGFIKVNKIDAGIISGDTLFDSISKKVF